MNGERREERAAEDEACHAGNFWIEPHGCEYVPGGHGSTVIVTRQAARASTEELGLDMAHNLLCAVGDAGSNEFPGHHELRFVPHESIYAVCPGVESIEVPAEAFDCLAVATHHSEQAI